MTDLIFDPPWFMLIGLAVTGLILLYIGLTKPDKVLKLAGTGVLAAGVAVYLLGMFVETGKERVSRETQELVAAADRRDWKTFSALLDPKVRFVVASGRDQLTSVASKTMDKQNVRNVVVTNVQPKEEPGGFTVTFTATADIEVMPHRSPTDWKFFWAKNPAGNGDLLYRIELLPNKEFGTDPVMTRLSQP